MKNQNRSPGFWNPYLNWSAPSFTIMAFLSLFTRCPLCIQVVWYCLSGLTLTAKLACVILPLISEIMRNRTNRKIKELDSETIRKQRNKSFSDNFTKLLEQAPYMSDSKVLTLTRTLEKYYNLEGQPPASEYISLLDSSPDGLPYENVTTNSPPQLHVVQKKKEKEKLYK